MKLGYCRISITSFITYHLQS